MYDEASSLLSTIEKNASKEEVATQFQFALLKGKVASALQQNEKAQTNYDAAFTLLINSKVAIESVL